MNLKPFKQSALRTLQEQYQSRRIPMCKHPREYHKIPNVFLTGAIRSGKSTAVNTALDQLKLWKIGGFRTISMPTTIPEALGVVYIVPVVGSAALDRNHLVGIRWAGNRFTAFAEAFEGAGREILAATPLDADIIIMDELGALEQNSPRFCAAVLALLDGIIPVLGVIKPQASPLLDAIRAHGNSRIIELNEENRDTVPDIITRLMHSPYGDCCDMSYNFRFKGPSLTISSCRH